MILSIVVGMAENGVIGRQNGLPWRLSTDLKRFKALTMGKPVVMGRLCYDSIGRPLPGRPNIVVTRNPDFKPEGIIVAHSLEEALSLAQDEAVKLGVEEVCIIGGGILYAEALAQVDVLHVTHIHANIEGDTFFPPIDPSIWMLEHSETVPAGEKDDYPTRYAVYRRKH